MHIPEIILKKRNGGTLSRPEINHFIDGYCAGDIPDYQAAALLMAIWFNHLDHDETLALTLAMRDSGEIVDLSAISGVKVDKHSTGGVGDTTTLVTGPLVAACGGKVAKMSGRGLGHTGGTLDKLEAIPGMSVSLDMERFRRIVSACGLAVMGQTADLVPADKKLYALRDVTGTVDNMALIAGSIMSKKLASGADAIVLDVKTGNGAFMPDPTAARQLAGLMVTIGNQAGRRTVALVTDMNQPLGNAVGNALEVREAIEILQGRHAGDLKTVSLALAAEMLLLGGQATNIANANQMLARALESGAALRHLARMIELQGGDPTVCRAPDRLPRAQHIIPVTADTAGFVAGFDTAALGSAARLLGAGRLTKNDTIDPAVGLWMRKRLGDRVAPGDILADMHINAPRNQADVTQRIKQAVMIAARPPTRPALIHDRITQPVDATIHRELT